MKVQFESIKYEGHNGFKYPRGSVVWKLRISGMELHYLILGEEPLSMPQFLHLEN